ncbi:MAG: hypothetical protein MJZ12_08410 [Prevotella sp.]|nr:hypothetical protein [Prevotella sp.]
MKKLIIIQVFLAILAMTACNNNSSKTDSNPAQEGAGIVSTPDTSDPFVAFAEHFSETASFAYAEVSGRKVLLVSQETFGNNVNEDKEAIEASIFALDKDDKIVALGSIRSQGTLYPVSLLDGKIMVAGHQFVRIYSIRGNIPELVLDSYGEGDGSDLTEMFKTFEKGTPIKFKKSLK